MNFSHPIRGAFWHYVCLVLCPYCSSLAACRAGRDELPRSLRGIIGKSCRGIRHHPIHILSWPLAPRSPDTPRARRCTGEDCRSRWPSGHCPYWSGMFPLAFPFYTFQAWLILSRNTGKKISKTILLTSLFIWVFL